jgi:predicted transglutaminase-like cysteine proteinase
MITTIRHAGATSTLLTTLLSTAILAGAADVATAKGRQATEPQTGFGALMRITPPQLSNPATAAPAAPARVFTISNVLAKQDGAAASVAAAQSSEPFGLFTFQAPEGPVSAKWHGVSVDIAKDAIVMTQCRAAPERCATGVARFVAIIDEARRHDGRERLDAVNQAVNQAIRYTTDMEQHGVADLWSAPLATFTSGRGDCEDYAIAKYVALREAGVAAEDLRILLVRDAAVREDHAVLAARQSGHWFILDNRNMRLIEDNDIKHFTALFAIDQSGVKLVAAPYLAAK